MQTVSPLRMINVDGDITNERRQEKYQYRSVLDAFAFLEFLDELPRFEYLLFDPADGGVAIAGIIGSI